VRSRHASATTGNGRTMQTIRPPRARSARDSQGQIPSAGSAYENEIPDVVIRRLPIYVRTLQILIDQTGSESVSSDQLAEAIGVSGAQIRRDLSYFGRFGKQGKGYDARRLVEEINRILRLDQTWEVALVGFGNLGRAIAQYGGFVPSTFRITCIFDRNEERVGQTVDGIVVESDARIAESIRELGVKIGIIAVPQTSAQVVADALVEGGIEAILNYAPCHLRTPESVTVRDVDPVGAMQSMTYYLSNGE
jgi:redox-sensing transcriptional repressor